MEMVAPLGPAYQAGTLSGNPLAMSAGIVTLDAVAQPGFYDALESRAARLSAGLTRAAKQAEIDCTVQRVGSILTGFFRAGLPTDFDSAAASDTAAYGRYFHAMLDRGVNLAPAQFEAMFVSAAHDDAAIDATIAAAEAAFSSLSNPS